MIILIVDNGLGQYAIFRLVFWFRALTYVMFYPARDSCQVSCRNTEDYAGES